MVPPMRTYLLSTLACLVAALLASGCGAGSEDRPVVVDVWPTNGAAEQGPIRYIRATYDGPVSILNPFDARVYANGALQGTTVFTDPAFPNSIFLEPSGGGTFPAGASIGVSLIQGIVINAGRHYSAAAYGWNFEVAREQPLPVTRPGIVTLFDPTTLSVDSGTPTPAGRDPIAAMRTSEAGVQRIWAQLDTGAGGGDALAYYTPGDAAMTVVTLTTAGGDLSCGAPALLLGPEGLLVYAAYRDEATGRIRVAEVDVATGAETASLELASVPSDAATTPAGITLRYPDDVLLISAHDGASGTLAFVDLATFTEIDQDDASAGIQGLVLDAGAGPIASTGDLAALAQAGNTDVTVVRFSNQDVSTSPSSVVGANVGLLLSADRGMVIQPLAGYADSLVLVRRTHVSAFTDPLAFPVSDDVGGVSSGATDATALQNVAGTSRFLLLLETPGGLILTSWVRTGSALTQLDLDPVTDGIQAADVEALLSGATSIGRTYAATEP